MLWQIIEIIGAVHGDIQTNIGDKPGTDWCHYNSDTIVSSH